jgi:hypothetical protein
MTNKTGKFLNLGTVQTRRMLCKRFEAFTGIPQKRQSDV